MPTNGVFQNTGQVTAAKLAKVFGRKVENYSMGGFGADSQKGALSAMGVIKCDFGYSTAPEAQGMQRGEMADVKSMVLKCMPQGFGERLFTDSLDMFEKEVLFYEHIGAHDCPVRVPKMYHAKQSGKKGYLLFEDLNDLPNAQFLSPWIADDELAKKVTIQMCENTMGQLAKLHAQFWESELFNSNLMSFSVRGRGLQGGRSKETIQNHFLYKQGWGKYLGFGILEAEPALTGMGKRLLKDFPKLYVAAPSRANAPSHPPSRTRTPVLPCSRAPSRQCACRRSQTHR
jgi:hypothetical protein